MKGQRRNREALAAERQRAGEGLGKPKANVPPWAPRAGRWRRRLLETEAAPFRYVAERVGADADSERAIRWLIAGVVIRSPSH